MDKGGMHGSGITVFSFVARIGARSEVLLVLMTKLWGGVSRVDGRGPPWTQAIAKVTQTSLRNWLVSRVSGFGRGLQWLEPPRGPAAPHPQDSPPHSAV